MKNGMGRNLFLFACVAPATLLFFIFMVWPTFNVFRMSLFERGAYSPTETFVGFANFQAAFADPKFIRSCQNMILMIVAVTIITFGFAIVFASILTRENIKGKNIFRVIFYIPNIFIEAAEKTYGMLHSVDIYCLLKQMQVSFKFFRVIILVHCHIIIT